MTKAVEFLVETPSQTAGPYSQMGTMPNREGGLEGIYPVDLGLKSFEDGAKGEVIVITGRLLDFDGIPILDATMESWQADANGKFSGAAGADPKVSGFCRFSPDRKSGEFSLKTIKPGCVAMRGGGMQAPHILLWFVMDVIGHGLSTRIYFEDEDNASDPVLSCLRRPTRASTLIAKKTGEGAYRFDIQIKGEAETVFFDM